MSDNNNEIMVSVSCLAYNHEPYIRDCLEGFVNQKTNFKFEVLIHDDASTDGTQDIIREYEEKYPDIIKPIYQKENQKSQGVRISETYQYPRVKGKYYSMCEGDDYWRDENKLQKQFEIMESNPDCSICTHTVQCVNKDKTIVSRVYPQFDIKEGKYTQDEFVDFLIKDRIKYPFHTSSYFFRKEVLDEYYNTDIEFRKVSRVGDFPLMLFFATKGNLYYFNDIMSCYRIMSKGSWSERNNSTVSLEKHIENAIETVLSFNKYSNYKYDNMIKKTVLRSEFELYRITRNYKKCINIRYRKFYFELGLKEKIYILVNALTNNLLSRKRKK